MFDFLWLFFWISSFLQVQVIIGILFRCLEERQMLCRKCACYHTNDTTKHFTVNSQLHDIHEWIGNHCKIEDGSCQEKVNTVNRVLISILMNKSELLVENNYIAHYVYLVVSLVFNNCKTDWQLITILV